MEKLNSKLTNLEPSEIRKSKKRVSEFDRGYIEDIAKQRKGLPPSEQNISTPLVAGLKKQEAQLGLVNEELAINDSLLQKASQDNPFREEILKTREKLVAQKEQYNSDIEAKIHEPFLALRESLANLSVQRTLQIHRIVARAIQTTISREPWCTVLSDLKDDPQRFIDLAAEGKFPPKELLVFFREYYREFEDDKQRLAELEAETKTNFIHEIKCGPLSMYITEECFAQYQERIENIPVVLTDSLVSLESTHLGAWEGGNRIVIPNDTLYGGDEMVRATLFHEYMHELAPRRILVSESENGESMYEMSSTGTQIYQRGQSWNQQRQSYPVQKPVMLQGLLGKIFSKFSPADSGNKSQTPDTKQNFIVINTWLNEAMTEYLARGLYTSVYQKKVEEAAYQQEIDEVKELINKGVPYDLFVKAYFEKAPPDNTSANLSRPALAELIKAINQVEGKYGFRKIENEFIMKSITSEMISARGNRIFSEGRVPKHAANYGTNLSIILTLGEQPEAEVSEQLEYVGLPVTEISKEVQMKRVERILLNVQNTYPHKKVRFEIK